MNLKRRKTPSVQIGSVLMGSQHPILVQSMTNTLTSDVLSTVVQIQELALAGSELVRITVNDSDAMKAVVEIVKRLRDLGVFVPIVGDFHYNGHVLLKKYPDSAMALDKYRINPGNVGKGDKQDENFADMVKCAIAYHKPIRIGVNWGSLDQSLLTTLMDDNAKKTQPLSFKEVIYEAMVLSAIQNAEKAESLGLKKNQLVLSVKMSDVCDMVTVYRRLAAKTAYVLHLGLTEAGSGLKGLMSSSAALSTLLWEGIGDTIRMSLTPEPGQSRTQEVKASQALLQSMGLRYFMPSVTSCPGCGRTNSDRFIYLAQNISQYIEIQMPKWKLSYPLVETLTVAVMGCVVNGPGESKFADIGISFPGAAEEPGMPVYQDGQLLTVLRGDQVESEFIQILERYIQNRFGK